MTSLPTSRVGTSNMVQRRNLANKGQQHGNENAKHDHDHDRDSGDHEHAGGIFHSHSHGEDEHHSHGAEDIRRAFTDKTDRGSQITLVGLYANVGLTFSKGAAGWFLHSASLMADAAHSLSDLLGDFITLFCWRWSKKPPTQRYPYGFGKFETLGTTTVSLLLIAGALGIGFHSYNLLLNALEPTITSMTPGVAQTILSNVTSAQITASVTHTHEHALDPNAAWFALISIVAKEWLYRITKRVADEEKSSVLRANALHHRSDAYTSVVAFFAILGSWWAPWLPLDPIGGLLVCFVILQQGFTILRGALRELMDRGVSPRTAASLTSALQPLVSTVDSESSPSPLQIISFSDLRAKRSGTNMIVDIVAHVPSTMTIEESSESQERIRTCLVAKRSEISEVRVKFVPVPFGSKNGHAY